MLVRALLKHRIPNIRLPKDIQSSRRIDGLYDMVWTLEYTFCQVGAIVIRLDISTWLVGICVEGVQVRAELLCRLEILRLGVRLYSTNLAVSRHEMGGWRYLNERGACLEHVVFSWDYIARHLAWLGA